MPVTPCLLDGAPAYALPLDDPAIWTGEAVFETLRTYAGRPFRLAAHLERLRASAAWMGLPFPDGLAAEVARVAQPEVRINVLLTPAHRVVRATPLDLARVGAPVRIVTRAWSPPAWLPGRVKHTSRAAWVLPPRQAGVDEVVWTRRGAWTEANRSNVFVVRGGALLTPPDDGTILAGVTRDALLDAARRAGVPCREARVKVGPVDEMYLSSSLKELAPVVEMDGAPMPGGGPVGARVRTAFRALVEAETRAAAPPAGDPGGRR